MTEPAASGGFGSSRSHGPLEPRNRGLPRAPHPRDPGVCPGSVRVRKAGDANHRRLGLRGDTSGAVSRPRALVEDLLARGVRRELRATLRLEAALFGEVVLPRAGAKQGSRPLAGGRGADLSAAASEARTPPMRVPPDCRESAGPAAPRPPGLPRSAPGGERPALPIDARIAIAVTAAGDRTAAMIRMRDPQRSQTSASTPNTRRNNSLHAGRRAALLPPDPRTGEASWRRRFARPRHHEPSLHRLARATATPLVAANPCESALPPRKC
jgi:hypothetical protein